MLLKKYKTNLTLKSGTLTNINGMKHKAKA